MAAIHMAESSVKFEFKKRTRVHKRISGEAGRKQGTDLILPCTLKNMSLL